MNFKIKNYRVEGDNVFVGFWVDSDELKLAIDKRVPIVLGKTDEDYINDAYALAKPEIDEWFESLDDIRSGISNVIEVEAEDVVEQYVDRRWSPDKGSFI